MNNAIPQKFSTQCLMINIIFLFFSNRIYKLQHNLNELFESKNIEKKQLLHEFLLPFETIGKMLALPI